jgi:hypothetical protein
VENVRLAVDDENAELVGTDQIRDLVPPAAGCFAAAHGERRP